MAALRWLSGALVLGVAAYSLAVGDQSTASKIGEADAQVLDGDTLQMGEIVVQLSGIDAPELGQTCLNRGRRWRCGLEAAFALKKTITGKVVKCDIRERGRQGLEIGVCRVDAMDLAEAQLSRGYAVVVPDGPPGYATAENMARAARLGMWRGAFVKPWEWREGLRLPQISDEPRAVCDIKAIVDPKGRRIYYVPTDEVYERIDIDGSRGDRMLCSDDQARLNGWKRLYRQ